VKRVKYAPGEMAEEVARDSKEPVRTTNESVESGPQQKRVHLTPGSVLDGVYRIEREIGSGGMGAVYLAEHTRLGRTFAVKVVTPARADDAEAVRRLEQEARSASAIDHENIVSVTHLGRTDDGSVFIVMEALDGEDVRARLTRVQDTDAGCLAFTEVRSIVEQTLAAIGAAHRAGIVHRDLKPENLYLDKKRGRLKVVDFGISKIRATEDEEVRLTQRGQVLGTPLYMAPEQGRDTSRVDHRADLYSLGCIAFELLTGRVPFECKTTYECLIAHATDPPPRAHEIRPDVPRAISEWVTKALAKNPNDRFQSADEMLDAWRAAWDPRSARARWPLWVAAIAIVLTVPFAIWLRGELTTPDPPPAPPPEPVAIVPEVVPPRPPPPPPEPVEPAAPPVPVMRTLASAPSRAEVWLAGALVGETPWQTEMQPGTSIEVELRKRGFVSARTTLSAEGPDPAPITLERRPRGMDIPTLAPR
jgi:serine/threonine protein kinase